MYPPLKTYPISTNQFAEMKKAYSYNRILSESGMTLHVNVLGPEKLVSPTMDLIILSCFSIYLVALFSSLSRTR